MKFPFSLFGKKPRPEEHAEETQDEERAPFPVDLAVAQVQAATGMRFGQQASPQSELLEAAAVLSGWERVPAAPGPTGAAAPPEPPPVAAPVPQSEPKVASVAAQGATAAPVAQVAADAGVGRDEVIAAYRLFLRRDPESDAVIEPRLGLPREKLLSTFMVSPEFLQRAESVKLVLEVAKSLELRQPVAATPGVPVMTPADVEAAKRIFWPEPHDQAIQPVAGESADRVLSQLMHSEHFQKNDFNAQLVTALAKQILERLNPK